MRNSIPNAPMRRLDQYTEGISIDIGFSCNNNCLFCVNEKNNLEEMDLATDKVKNMMEEVKEFLDGIILNGGEPTIRNDIAELVSHAKNIGFKAIMMISNGRMFSYESFCKILYRAGLRLVFVTIEAPTAKVHDALTSVNGSFAETVQGIQNLKKNGIEVYTNTVINKLNYSQLCKLPAFLSKLDIRYAKLSFIRTRGTNVEKNFKKIVPRITAVAPYVRSSAREFIRSGMDFIIQEIPPCILRSHIAYIRKSDKFPVIDKTHPNADSFATKYGREGNIKLKRCKECYYDPICHGPWQEYIRYFGDGEFKPISKIP